MAKVEQEVVAIASGDAPVLGRCLGEAGEENVKLVERILLEMFRQEIELEEDAQDFFILPFDVVEELPHDRRREPVLDLGEVALNAVELALQLIESGCRILCALDSDFVDEILEPAAERLEVVGIRDRALAQVLEHASKELIKGPERAKAIGQYGIPNARSRRAWCIHDTSAYNFLYNCINSPALLTGFRDEDGEG
jgi:hypothetical protein